MNKLVRNIFLFNIIGYSEGTSIGTIKRYNLPAKHFLDLSQEQRHKLYLEVSQDKHYFVNIIKITFVLLLTYTYWYFIYYDRNNRIINRLLSYFNKEKFEQRKENFTFYNEYLKTLSTDQEKQDAINILEIVETYEWKLSIDCFQDFHKFCKEKEEKEGGSLRLRTEKLRKEFNNTRLQSALLSYIAILGSIVFFKYSHVFNWESFLYNLFSNFMSALPMIIGIFGKSLSSYDRCIMTTHIVVLTLFLNVTFLINHKIIHKKAENLPSEEIERYLSI